MRTRSKVYHIGKEIVEKNDSEMASTVMNLNNIEPFNANHLTIWFRKLERHFSTELADEKKTAVLLTIIPSEILSKVGEEHLEENYEQLKARIKEVVEDSLPERIHHFLTSRASATSDFEALARELKTLSQQIGCDETLPKAQFLEILPDEIAKQIYGLKDVPLIELGKQANQYRDFIFRKNQRELINNVQRDKENAMHNQTMPESKFSGNRREFRGKQALLHKSVTAPKKLEFYENMPHGLRPFSRDQRPKICRYHVYFAERSTKCRQWCRWPNKSEKLEMTPSSRPTSPFRA